MSRPGRHGVSERFEPFGGFGRIDDVPTDGADLHLDLLEDDNLAVVTLTSGNRASLVCSVTRVRSAFHGFY